MSHSEEPKQNRELAQSAILQRPRTTRGGSLVLRVHDADAAAAAVHVDEQVVELPLPRRVLVHVCADAPHARRPPRDKLHLPAARGCTSKFVSWHPC